MSMTSVLIIMVIILIALIALNSSIWVALLGVIIFLQVFVNGMSLQSLFTGLFEALTKNTLLAIPFFILTGSLIAKSSLGTRLVNVFLVLLKNVRGGFAISCLLSNAIFGAISGSAPASVATFGQILHEPLAKAHGKNMSLGLITSSGALSIIIPPSVTLIIYGVATEQPISTLFLCGFLPGLLIVFIVGSYLIVKCKNNALAGEKPSKNEILITFKKGIVVLVLPILILGGIYGGFCTPTESGAIAALYSFIASVFVLKDIKIKQLPEIFREAAKIIVQIFILIAVCTVFAQAIAIAQFPEYITSIFANLSSFQFLLVLNILLLVMGCFFDTGAAILIFAPILLPTAIALGISPLHLGIIFTVNLAIGMFTPPFGMNIFVSQGILKCKMSEVSKGCIPFIVLYIIALLMITYIPEISLILPRLAGAI